MADEEPEYKVYRSRPRLLRKNEPEDGLAGLRTPDTPPPDYEVQRRRRLPSLPKRAPRVPGRRRRITPGRVLKWVAIGLFAWVGVSALLFMVSAQIQRGDLASEVGEQLDPGPYPLTGANTILVLGSDARTEGLAEPGSGGPSRADSIMLLRIGGGANASLSIPRDTVVDIPGHGPNKINAAYAFGGAALATQTVKEWLGVEINHVVEVSFENFPQLIDALGGVTYKGDAVLSRINGGNRNGGYTLRLPAGETEINGRQALALARTRKNLRNASEDDLTRARRQQQLVAAMKDKVTSFETFVRLPWVSWAAPKAVRSDMAGPTLLGVALASMRGGDSEPRVLKPSGGVTLPDGGMGLTVDDQTKQQAVDQLLEG
jgi:LCP family protein required for cell wall assembly